LTIYTKFGVMVGDLPDGVLDTWEPQIGYISIPKIFVNPKNQFFA
jgi:hypothetical protein